MPKTILNIDGELLKKIDEHVAKWSFKSRAEFLRFAAIDFIRNDARYMPADKILAVHTKAIRSIKARQGNKLF